MTDLIDTTEMYLRTIYELLEDHVVPMRARIAEHLGHSGPTVSQTIARMERDGLVHVRSDRTLELTDDGSAIAARVMRKHRLAECLLTDVVGLTTEHAHDEACRWEHVMSERVELRLLELLGSPRVSPYGNPIPALEELIGADAEVVGVVAATAAAEASEQWHPATVIRIGETAQALPGMLGECTAAGVSPGASVRVRRVADRIELETPSGTVTIPLYAARHVFLAGTLASS